MGITDLNFDDLVPEKRKPAKATDLSFDDLVPTTGGGIAKAALAAIPKGLAGVAGAPAALDQLGKAGVSWLVEKLIGKPAEFPEGMPTPMGALLGPGATIPPDVIREQMERITGPLYEPQNRAEKLADTFTQFAVGMGRPNASTLAKIVAPTAAGTEAAGALSGDDPRARLAGGLAGGGVGAIASAYRGIPANTVRQAVGDVTPEQMNQALMRQGEAMRQGVPLMGAESMPNSGIQQLASDVMASRTGAPVMRQFLDQRPDQVRGAVGGMLGQMGPQMTPEAAAALAQRAATGQVRAAEQARSNVVAPYYKAASNDNIPASAIQNVEQAIAAQRPQFTLPAQQNALDNYAQALGQPQTPITLDNLYKSAREAAEVAQIGASSADKQAAQVVKPLAQALKAASETSPNIKQGRQLYEQVTESVIDPMVAGPVGRVAGMKSGGFDPASTPPVQRIVSELSNPATARPETIRELHTALNKQDKTAFPAIARTYLENSFDHATKRVQSGENVRAGATFANEVRGTDQQRANFDEILRGVAQANGKKPDQLVKGANVLMDTLAATGKIPGTGSQTATRLGTQAELSRNPLSAAADMLSTKPLNMFARGADGLFNARRNRLVAEWLTAPDSVEIIVKMAKLKPTGLTARYYLTQLLNANKEFSESAQ